LSLYKFSVIQTYDELFALKQQWDDLLEHAIFDSFFCCHDWICCWWQSFSQANDKLTVVLAGKDGKLAAIAPLMNHSHKEYGFSLKVLRFICVPNADRSDVIICKGSEDVIPELADFLLKKVHGWDQLHLNEVPEESLFANWLIENKSLVFVEQGSECPFVPLANWESWEDYYASLSRNTRKLANRKGNRLEKEGLSSYYQTNDFQYDSQLFKQAGELEKASEKAGRIERLVLGDQYQYDFQEGLARNPSNHKVLLVGLVREGKLLAYLYGFIYKNKYYAYNTAYSTEEQKHSPGLLVFRETIKFCKEHDVLEFDFLRGAMQIKKHWAKDTLRKQNNVFWLKHKPTNWLYDFAVFKLRPFLKKNVIPFLRKK